MRANGGALNHQAIQRYGAESRRLLGVLDRQLSDGREYICGGAGCSVVDFATYPSSASIVQWDYMAFIANYSLGAPVASNWHVTMHSA